MLAQIHSKVISGHPENQELRSSPKKENNRQKEEILRRKIVIKKNDDAYSITNPKGH